MKRIIIAALAVIASALIATPAHADEPVPCAPTAIVFDFCERVPDVEYPGDNDGAVPPRPEDVIGKTMLCPDGSYGTVIDLDYNMDCTVDMGSPETVVEVPPAVTSTAPAPAADQPAPVAGVPAAAPADNVVTFDAMAFVRELFARIFGWLFV